MHLTRLRDGTRRITHVTEVQGMEGDVITLQDIFLFDFGMGVDEHGRFHGHLKATGVRPKFAEKLADLGIRLGHEVFQPEGVRPQGGRARDEPQRPADAVAVFGVRRRRRCSRCSRRRRRARRRPRRRRDRSSGPARAGQQHRPDATSTSTSATTATRPTSPG